MIIIKPRNDIELLAVELENEPKELDGWQKLCKSDDKISDFELLLTFGIPLISRQQISESFKSAGVSSDKTYLIFARKNDHE